MVGKRIMGINIHTLLAKELIGPGTIGLSRDYIRFAL